MIEKKIVQEKFLEYKIRDYLLYRLKDVPIKEITLEKSPVGERINVKTRAPGLVIGNRGENIANLTEEVKKKFELESPQIKINDVKNPNLSADIVARNIASNLKRYGSMKFKLTGYKTVDTVMKSGAVGVEVILSGKIPSARARSWRFASGFVKKTGYASDFIVEKSVDSVCLKTGVIGINVKIMLPDTPLPQKVYLKKSTQQQAGAEAEAEASEENQEEN